jgi:tetratricopeptide (TPR) repeat protein
MKAVFRISFLIAAIGMISTGLYAQRTVKGTVYNNGEPAAGVNVEVHRGGSMMTSFDGKYELEASDKTRWIRFTSVTESKRFDISGKSGNTFDFAFDGKIPSDTDDNGGDDVVLKSAEELIRDQDREFMNQLSLFNEFYKQENYESAMPHWRILYNKYPKSTLNLYIRGVIMYEDLIENANSAAEKEKYIDELMRMYDKRIRYFGEKGFVLGRKATSWLKYKLEDRDLANEELLEILKKGYDWINESINEQGNKTELPVLVLLMQTTRSLFLMNEIPKETVVKNYNTTNEILEAIRTTETDGQRLKNVEEVHAFVEDIFGTSGAADCEALTNILSPQFEQNRNDAEFVKGMLRRLRAANCDESQLFAQATQQLYELEPSAEAAFNMARRFVRRDETEKAKDFYQQAMEQETNKELLSRYYYEYAIFIFAKESDLQESRKYARMALEINPAYCEALTLMGDIYISASRTFNPETDFEKSAIFWVAVDYYERARQHPDCAVDAAKKANDYRRYFPSKEDAFFLGLQEGQTYKVGGWINETTRIRF